MAQLDSRETSVLSLVVPCFNEEDVLRTTAQKIKEKFQHLIERCAIDPSSRIYFVDDGSTDLTWSIIEELGTKDQIFGGIKLAKNRGHQNALLAGLLSVDGDIVISMDADLQDDIDAIDEMLNSYYSGAEIVYGVRSTRDTDTFLKKFTAEGYYKLLKLMGVDLVFNHADYRLLSRKVLNALGQYDEVNLFVRGIIPSLGFKSAIVEYARSERYAGESKYPLSKMLKLAWDGITSFSHVPLRIITAVGFITSIFSMMLIFWVFWTRLFTDAAIPGWASTTIPPVFFGGAQLLSLGVIGEYIAKIYLETKARPRFIIEERM